MKAFNVWKVENIERATRTTFYVVALPETESIRRHMEDRHHWRFAKDAPESFFRLLGQVTVPDDREASSDYIYRGLARPEDDPSDEEYLKQAQTGETGESWSGYAFPDRSWDARGVY